MTRHDESLDQNDFGGGGGGGVLVAADYGHAHITNNTLCMFLDEVTAQIVHGSLEPTRQSERSLSFINLYIFQRIVLPPNYEIHPFLYILPH